MFNIRHTEGGGVQLVGRPHAGEHRHPGRPAPLDQQQLGGDGVDAVQHVVELGQVNGAGGVGAIEQPQRRDPDGGVNVRDAGGHGVHLVLPQRGAQRHQLAVEVGGGDGVAVHQRQRAHAAAGQDLGGMAPHPADAEHRHAGGPQRIQRVLSQKPPCAAVWIVVHSGVPPLVGEWFGAGRLGGGTGGRLTFVCRRPLAGTL